ncbi:hypothetical protein HWV62_42124 [Athelia sp. TMB]|nr:hypothetical protein HWV62_42124 [Athelia sp. TMB]
MLLHAILHLLASVSTIVARAVGTDASSIPDANTTSFVASAPTNTTLPEVSCKDIDHCRTLVGIVQSCILTILACVWFAVHRNIPAPKADPPRYDNIFVKTYMFIWAKILNQKQAVTVFLATLLVPEWVLAWALRQFFVARRLVEELEKAREHATQKRETDLPQGREAEKEPSESTDDRMEDESIVDSSGMSTYSEHDGLIKRHVTTHDRLSSRRCKGQCGECGVHPSVEDVREAGYDQVAVALRVAKVDEEWKMAHAFFVIMGGYYFYSKKGPRHPLSPAAVVELVRRGHLVAPTSDELANQSKGDALSKGVAIVQTLWFVMQCIARRIEHLPVTSLEVMTLAYTVITVAMYIVWWDKPLNVSCAVRVPEEAVEDEKVEQFESIGERILAYVTCTQDRYVDLRKCSRVPTFWAGDRSDGPALIADSIALLVAMVFGAVHCIAWFDGSQSPLEQHVWRASAIAIIAVPPALAAVLALVALLGETLSLAEEFMEIATSSFYVPSALIYIAARLALISISFTSLRMLPAAAYQTVQWTTLVPHI